MADLLSAQQVRERFNLSRNDLLRYEAAGVLDGGISRTSGGQRRYDAKVLTAALTTGIQPAKPRFDELGVTGRTKYHARSDDEPLRELQGAAGYKLLREMKLNDPVIGASFLAMENSLKQATMRIKPFSEKPADKECADFVARSIDDQSFSWSDTMDFILEMLLYGCSPLNIVYKRCLGMQPPPYTADAATSQYADGRIAWRKWAPRSLTTLVEGNEFNYDEHGSIQGINQVDPGTGATVTIPINELLLFRTTPLPLNGGFGMPVHRAAYVSYYYSRNFQEIEGIMVERDGAGIPVFYLGNDCSHSGANSDFELAKDAGVNLRQDEQACLVIPHAKMGAGAAEGSGMLVELLSSSGQRAHDVSQIIRRYDERKALSMLTQFLLLGLSSAGSYALARVQGDIFSVAVSAWLQKISEVVNRYAIPRLLSYNVFPKITGQPQMIFSDVGIPDLQGIANFINSAVSREVIKPDPELERALRQLAHLPEPAPVKIGSGQTTTKPAKTMDTALILRRVILALKELPDYSGLSDEQLMTLVTPLISQLVAGVEQDTGQKIVMPTENTSITPDANSDVNAIIAQLTKKG